MTSLQPYTHVHEQPLQQESVRGLTTCVFDDHPVVLTGGTDRIIRLWNLRDPDRCCCVMKPKQLQRVQFDYQYVMEHGIIDMYTLRVPSRTFGGGGGELCSEALYPNIWVLKLVGFKQVIL